jgi:hypothetical protein
MTDRLARERLPGKFAGFIPGDVFRSPPPSPFHVIIN